MQKALWRSPFGQFRIIAFAEGLSYLMLGITMPLKYLYEMPQPNYVVGMLHGLLFVLYVGLLLLVARQYRWSLLKSGLAFLAALVPFGTFIADRKLYNRPI